MDKRLAAGRGQDGDSCSETDCHSGDLDEGLNEAQRAVDWERQLTGDAACDGGDRPGHAERAEDLLSRGTEQELMQPFLCTISSSGDRAEAAWILHNPLVGDHWEHAVADLAG